MTTLRSLAAAACALCGLLTSAAFAQTETAPPPSTESADPIETKKIDADSAYRQGKYAAAIDLANQVLQTKPEDHVALYIRASSRVEWGARQQNAAMIRDGIKDAREAIRIQKQGKADYYLPYLYGMTSLSIVEAKPAHAETAVGTIKQLIEKNKYSSDELANLYYQQGLAHIQTRANDLAIDDFKQAIKRKADHLAAHVALCNVTNQAKGRDDALIAFNQAIASVPNSALLLNNRGMHFHSMGRDREAIIDLTAALKADPKFITALINRGFVHMQAGRANEAETDLTAAVEMDPANTQAYQMRGNARIGAGRAADAIADYTKVTELDPHSGMAFADLGIAKFFSGDFNGALDLFDRALSLSPQIAFLTPWRVAAAKRAGKDLSKDPAVAAAASKDAGTRTWFDWLTLHQLGKISDADLLAAANPSDVNVQKAQQCEAYYFIGLELMRKKMTDDARASFHQAVETDAERLSAFRGARIALKEIGEPK